MKKILLFAACSLFLLGCNMNPSKEARIQDLEAESGNAQEKIRSLEDRVLTLEDANKDLMARILKLESE